MCVVRQVRRCMTRQRREDKTCQFEVNSTLDWKPVQLAHLNDQCNGSYSWTEVVENDWQAGKLNKEDAVDRSRWKKLIKDVRRSGRVRVGECFSWHRPSRVVPDKSRYTTRLNVVKLSLRNIRSSNLGPDSQNTLRQSYDYRTITPKLRLTSNLRNLLRRTQGFPWYDSLATSQDRSR